MHQCMMTKHSFETSKVIYHVGLGPLTPADVHSERKLYSVEDSLPNRFFPRWVNRPHLVHSLESLPHFFAIVQPLVNIWLVLSPTVSVGLLV